MKKIYKVIVVLFVILVLFIVGTFINKKKEYIIDEDDRVYLVQISNIMNGKTINKFHYYNGKGKLVKTEEFSDRGDVSYNSVYENKIFSYGPGGLYETDVSNFLTKKLFNEDINIVHFFENEMYYYVNIGFGEDNKYNGKICNKNNCLDVDTMVLDFFIKNNYTYILGLDCIYIYDGEKLLKQVDLAQNKPFQNLLRIGDRGFIVYQNQIMELKNSEIENFSENNILKDINFELYPNNNKNSVMLFDRNRNSIFTLSIENEIFKEESIEKIIQNWRVSYSFKNFEIMYYIVDYNNKEIIINNNNDSIKLKIQLSKNDSVFKVYEIK